MTSLEFLRRLERALALLWWVGRDDPTVGMSAAAVCTELERAGHPMQNKTRLATALRAHRGTSKAARGEWRLHPRMRQQLDAEYVFAIKPKALVPSSSVLPMELFTDTRGYIERVVEQINQSYEVELWDCSAVMSRRLLETLIIETYEKAGRANEIKGSDGNFMMLNGLLAVLEQDSSVHLGRNASKGLKDFKRLGDLSAHSRRFNAGRDDIDRVRDGLRVAAEELVHLAGFRN